MTASNSLPTALWYPDDGHGGYVNPVLFADYSDPDVCRVGNDFWMTASSFNCTPGLPILHSTDLVNWTLVGHALQNLPDPRYATVQPGCGVWAPAIRFHAGKFWIFFPTPDEGIYVTTAADPRGPWSKPHLMQPGRGLIDPCPLWDDDGRAYLTFAYAGSRAGIKHRLEVREMDPSGSHLFGPTTTIFHDPENHPTAEGPKFYKRDGKYYVFAPAGGVPSGWQLVLRSDCVLGPYEHRIVLAQGATNINGPHQGGLVDTPTGEWWFLHFQERQPYGRIVHLQPVKWIDGWPLIGEPSSQPGVGQPVQQHAKPGLPASAPAAPATSDSFDTETLGPQWQWYANHDADWYSLAARPGWLRLRTMPVNRVSLELTPHLLLQKLPAPAFAATTRAALSADDTAAGIAVVGNESAALWFERSAGGYRIALRIGRTEVHSARIMTDTAELRVELSANRFCTFSYRASDDWITIFTRFKAVEGKWIGAKVGIVADGNLPDQFVDFDYFRIDELSDRSERFSSSKASQYSSSTTC